MLRLCLFSCLLFSSGISAQSVDGSIAELFNSINERLDHMESVGLYKSQNQLPIEDVTRETVVIETAMQTAAEEGVNPGSVEHFYHTQISVAKAIQYRFRAELLSTPDNSKAADLENEIRPAISALGDKILILLADYLQKDSQISPDLRTQFNQSISNRFVSPADKKMLFDALLEVRLLQP